ncbi:MAG TPA: response regulator [Verrucomicrobiae bacterium]|nr:response regulator [Verrucomicrobiae bacterium]
MKKSKWILLAEDDSPLAELTTLALAPDKLACEVIVARDGVEALDCIRRRGEFQTRAEGLPALVLLDLKMPRVDGLEVLRQIKADTRLKHIPVVMFTSSRELADVNRSYQLGANAYVVKPVDFQKFSQTLAGVGWFWTMLNELPPVAAPRKTPDHDVAQLAAAE